MLALAATATFAVAHDAHAEDVFAVTSENRLVTFDEETPGDVTNDVAITGLAGGEQVIAIDVRADDRQLYGVTDQDRVYSIDPETGAATTVSSLPGGTLGEPIGADFDPETGDLRFVLDGDRNGSIAIATGAVTDDDTLEYKNNDPNRDETPELSALAFVGPGLFGIDTERDELVFMEDPSNGELETIDRLGVDAEGSVGLDGKGGTGLALASINVGGKSGLYDVDIETGYVAFRGTIGDGTEVRDIARAVRPEELLVDKLQLKFNFKKGGNDQVHLRGKLQDPNDGDYEGLVAVVDIGGIVQTYTLDKKGKGKVGQDTFMLEGKPKDGLVKFDVKYKKGDFADDFADEGMDGTEEAKKEEREVVVTVTIDGVTYEKVQTVIYTAKVGKNGNAKEKK
jgi:hypothetical protein